MGLQEQLILALMFLFPISAGVVTVTAAAGSIPGISTAATTELTHLTVAGVSTFTGAIDANGDLDVDGHTNLDNVSIAGIVTVTGNIDANSDADIKWKS